MITENLFSIINSGRNGGNIGISTGLRIIDKYTYGIQKGWMTVIGGDTGSGKSSYVLFTSVYNTFANYLESLETDNEFDVKYLIFSFEMSAEVLFAKILSMHLYYKYGVVISYEEILSFKEPLSEDKYLLIQQEIEWIRLFESKCLIHDKPCTSKQLYAICKSWAETNGKFTELENGTEVYEMNNKKLIPIVILDHIALLKLNTGHTKKQEIDECCDYLIWFRNKCNFCIYIVQQLNRNFKSMDRRKDKDHFELGLEDFSDSSGTVQAAEIVIAIYNPHREKRSSFLEYVIKGGLGRVARGICILKHRFGIADQSLVVGFYGENSVWKQLPPPNLIDYEQFKTL